MLTCMQKVKKRYINDITSKFLNKIPPLLQIHTKSSVKRKYLDSHFYNSGNSFVFILLFLMAVSVNNVSKTHNMIVINYIYLLYMICISYICTHIYT